MLEGKCGNLCERACEKQGGVCEEIHHSAFQEDVSAENREDLV